MKWQGRAAQHQHRGSPWDMRMGLPIGGGIGGIVLLLLFSALTGTNPADLINSAPGSSSDTSRHDRHADRRAGSVRGDRAGRHRATSGARFSPRRAARYQPPPLVLFSRRRRSACGVGQSAMGPFYCPRDQKLYIDLSFFQELDRRFGAPGDFAQAYVIAHEVGHHVQNADRPRCAVAGVGSWNCRPTATPASGAITPPHGCSIRATSRKVWRRRRRSATTACSSSRRGVSFPSRSPTDRRPSASAGCAGGWSRAGRRAAIRPRQARSRDSPSVSRKRIESFPQVAAGFELVLGRIRRRQVRLAPALHR